MSLKVGFVALMTAVDGLMVIEVKNTFSYRRNKVMKIKYRHFRVLETILLGDTKPSRIVLPYSRGNPKFTPAPTGGETVCEITWTNGMFTRGVAVCSDSDQFCYAAGRKLALDRAGREKGDCS